MKEGPETPRDDTGSGASEREPAVTGQVPWSARWKAVLRFRPTGSEENPSDSEDEEHDPEFSWKRLLLGRKFWISVIVAALAGAGIAYGPGLYREIKARRALGIIAGAEEAMKRGDEGAALEKLRTGFSMAPGDLRVLRILRRYKAEAGDPDSAAALAGMVADGSATVEERLALAGLAIKKKDSALAARALDSLPGQLPPDLDARRILARTYLLANEGRLAEAARMLREAWLPPDQMQRIWLVLGSLLLTTSPETEAEGWHTLENLGSGDTREGLEALRQMADHQISTKRTGWQPDRLLVHPMHTYSDVLLGAQVRMAEPEAGREKIVEELVAGASGLGIDDRCSLARWLLVRGFPEQARGIFSAGDLAASEPAFLLSADALAAQNRWEEVRSLLNEKQRPPLDEALRLLFLARVARQLGDSDASEAYWQTLRPHMPFSKPNTLRQIADDALKAGHPERARHAIELLVERKEATPGDFAGLLRMLPPNATTDESLALLDKFLAAYPQIPEVRGDHAYLSLLLGRDIEASRATAGELFQQQPKYLAFLSVLALAELRLGHPAEAARLYEGREIDWKDAPAHMKAIRIAVLRANGLAAEADALSSALDPASLRPEEQELARGGEQRHK